MQIKRLSYETEARVCILCGRDDIPRQTVVGLPAEIAVEAVSIAIPANKRRRTCPGCSRDGLIFSGSCQRCRWRAARGLDLITGEPINTNKEAA